MLVHTGTKTVSLKDSGSNLLLNLKFHLDIFLINVTVHRI